MSQHPTIAILGGGPGRLTLARILATRGVSATVFERDAHPLERPQGGSLDLHADPGQRALREAGLEAEFRALARYDDQYDADYDHQGTLYVEQSAPGDGDRPEIDRAQLRSLLLDSLPPGTVRWGRKVSGVTALADGRYRVAGSGGALGDTAGRRSAG